MQFHNIQAYGYGGSLQALLLNAKKRCVMTYIRIKKFATNPIGSNKKK